MSTAVAILIPTFERSHSLQRVVDNIHENTLGEYTIYFIAEPRDLGTIKAVKGTTAQLLLNEQEPCYAGAINTAYHKTKEPYLFLGADDLAFHQGWLKACLSRFRYGVEVVGTNDLAHPDVLAGTTATHSMVTRRYIREEGGRADMKDTVLYPYKHNYCDTEFIATAKARGVFMPCLDSKVEHLHWAWGKAPMDSTYRKGFGHNTSDRLLYQERSHLWR